MALYWVSWGSGEGRPEKDGKIYNILDGNML